MIAQEYFETAILYSCVIFAGLLLSLFIKEEDCLRNKILLGIIVTLLTLLCGFRGETVGRDTEGYIRIINADGIWDTMKDVGFIVFIRVVKTMFGSNPQWVLFMASLLTNTLIIIALYRFRKSCDFFISMVVFLTMYYFLTFSALRQWIAVAFVALSIVALYEHKLIGYFLSFAIACTFHTSAICSIAFFVLYLFTNKRGAQSKWVLLVKILICAVGAIVGLTILLVKYSHWIDTEYLRSGDMGMMIYALAVLIAAFVAYDQTARKGDNRYIIWKQPVYWALIAGLVMRFGAGIIGGIIRNIGRIEWYTAIPYCLLIGGCFNKKSDEVSLAPPVINKEGKLLAFFFKALAIFIAVYEFYYMLKNSGSGQLPYVFFWQ